MPTPTALDAARKFRQELANQEAQAAERMATIYSRIYTGLLPEAQALGNELAAMETISRGKVLKLARVQSMLQQVKEQATRFGGTVQGEVLLIQNQAIEQGIDNALKLMELSMPDLPPDVRGSITGSFNRLPKDAVEAMAGLVGPDSPLKDKLDETFGEYVAGRVKDELLTGIAAGRSPIETTRRIERNLQNGLGSGLTSVLTTVRTAQIKSYQTANHATYRANAGVVKGWVWHAELDKSTCLSCIAMHGTVHDLDETLDDHHNGRCAPLPITFSYEDLGLDVPETVEPIESGEDWFNRQPASVQREMMGPGIYEEWEKGHFEFGDLSQRYNDPVYGEMWRQASLKELTEGGGETPSVSGRDFTAGYQETLKEIESIKANGEFYEGELQDALDKLELEKEISAGLRDIGLSPARMTEDDWTNAAQAFQNRAFDNLTYATEAQREAAGNLAAGRRFVDPGERRTIQVGGQDIEQKWTGGSAAAARRITQEINQSTKDEAQRYMGDRLREFGYDNGPEMGYEQQRRLLAKIGQGEEGDVTPRQQADALEIAYNPRAAKGMKFWEYYEISMVKGGREDEIQAPPDNRENFLPGFLTPKKKLPPARKGEEIDF